MSHNRWVNVTVLFVFAAGSLGMGYTGSQSAAAAPLAEEPLYVKPAPDGDEDCSSWDDACGLQDALEASEYGDQIWVASGIYTPTYQTDPLDERSATFEMEPGVALYGGFAGNEMDLSQRDWENNITVLSGDLEGDDLTDLTGVVTDTTNIIGSNVYHVISSEGVTETAILDGITITGGKADGGFSYPCNKNCGGGIYNYYTSPQLANLTFSGNMANYGGGMLNFFSNPLLTKVNFNSNTAEYNGGGMNNYVGSSPVLSNVNLSDNSGFDGGGMYNSESSPELTDVTFSGNMAGNEGGGMTLFNCDASPVLTNVDFSSNSALRGGGLISGGCNSILNDVSFTGNISEWGGGMHNNSSNPVLINVTFSSNTATYGGGGITNRFSSPSLTNVIFCGNTSNNNGGGLYNHESDPALTNVTFSGNTARGFGGGMDNYAYSAPVLTNVTFSSNYAESGGGMSNIMHSSPTITNTILWGNTAEENGQQIYNIEESSSTIRYSDIQGGCETITGNDCSGGGNIDADPLFERNPDPGPDGIWGTPDDDYGDLRLGPLSLAIDAGDNAGVPSGVTTDLDGNPRFDDIPGVPDTGSGTSPIVDMGAYEAVNLVPVAQDDLDYTTAVDIPLSVSAPGVLQNDHDPNIDPITAAVVDDPGNGDLTLSSDGSFEYTPEAGYTGIVTFTYQAIDSLLTSNIALVEILVNDIPQAVNDSYDTEENTPLVVPAPGILANDDDTYGDPLQAVLEDGTSTGTLALDPSGSFSYTPAVDFTGVVTFTYHATDGLIASLPATVTITIEQGKQKVYLPLITH